MKKISILLVLTVIFSIIILAGCSQETASPTTTKIASSTTAPATTITKAPSTTTAGPTPTTTTPAASPTQKTGGTFKVATTFAPTKGLGWFADGSTFRGSIETDMMIETLIRGDYNGNFTPFLATAWETAQDLKSIKLTLRKGVKFHDGSDFNATVAKWNIDQSISANVSNVAGWTSVDVIDDYTIRINVTKVNNLMINQLANCHIVSKAAYDQAGGGKAGQDYLRSNPVGTGPFKFVSYTNNVVLKVAKFKDYWQAGKPYLDAVEMYFFSDPLVMSSALQAGEMDAYINATPTKTEYDLQQKRFTILKNYSGLNYLAGDSKNADSPYSNLKVRQAVDYAIDRDAISNALGYGFWLPSAQFALPGRPDYVKDLQARTYNVNTSKQLLTEAGYPSGFKTSIFGGSLANRDATTSIQTYLSKVGITVDVNMVDIGAFVNYQMQGWKNGMLTSGASISANPNEGIAAVWSQKAPQFKSLLKTDEFEALFQAASTAASIDPVLQQKVTRYIFDNAMFLPLYATASCAVVNPYVHDTSFYNMQIWSMWSPYDTWLSK